MPLSSLEQLMNLDINNDTCKRISNINNNSGHKYFSTTIFNNKSYCVLRKRLQQI